jgi:hypothetical protein
VRRLGPDDKAFDAKFAELIRTVEHHVEEEEREMFPRAEEELEADQHETPSIIDGCAILWEVLSALIGEKQATCMRLKAKARMR